MAKRTVSADSGNIEPEKSGGGNDGADSSVGDAPTFIGKDFFITPASIGSSGGEGNNSGSDTGEPVRKRRGRKPGSRNREKKTPLDIAGVEMLLLSTHQMLAALTKTSELVLDQDEAHQLAVASVNVARHYDVQATEKTLDWIGLFMAIGAVYGPRVVMLGMKSKERKVAKQAEQTERQANGAAAPHVVFPAMVPN